MGLLELGKGWFVLILLLTSALWWVTSLSAWFSKGEPLIPQRAGLDKQPPRNPLAVLLMLLWLTTISYGVAGKLVADFSASASSETSEASEVIENTDSPQDKVEENSEPAVSVNRVAENALQNGILLLLLLLALTEMGRISLDDLGMEFDESFQDFTWALRGTIAASLPVFTVQIILQQTEIRQPENEHQLLQLLEQDQQFRTIGWIFLSAVVIAPMLEELLFRVILQRWLSQQLGGSVAIGVTACWFSFVHGWPDMLPLFPLALVLGYVYHRQGRYWMVVILHMLFNLMNFLLAILA